MQFKDKILEQKILLMLLSLKKLQECFLGLSRLLPFLCGSSCFYTHAIPASSPLPPGFNKLSWGLGLQVLGENCISHIGKIKAMFISRAKIMKPNGEKLDKFQSEIFYTLLELQMNSELKTQLQELNITAAKATEVSVGQKALLIFVFIPQMKCAQKFQVWLLRDLEKFSRKHVVCCSEENSA